MAARVAAERPEATLIPTGGDPTGVGVTEAKAIATLLGELGVARERMVLEEEARNTFDNAVLVLRMVEELGAGVVVVVTSHFHLPRAAWLFRTVARAMGLVVAVEARGATGEGPIARNFARDRWRLVKEGRKIVARRWAAALRGVGLDPEGMEGMERPLRELAKLLERGPELEPEAELDPKLELDLRPAGAGASGGAGAGRSWGRSWSWSAACSWSRSWSRGWSRSWSTGRSGQGGAHQS
jgi:hypothetical protein